MFFKNKQLTMDLKTHEGRMTQPGRMTQLGRINSAEVQKFSRGAWLSRG